MYISSLTNHPCYVPAIKILLKNLQKFFSNPGNACTFANPDMAMAHTLLQKKKRENTINIIGYSYFWKYKY